MGFEFAIGTCYKLLKLFELCNFINKMCDVKLIKYNKMDLILLIYN